MSVTSRRAYAGRSKEMSRGGFLRAVASGLLVPSMLVACIRTSARDSEDRVKVTDPPYSAKGDGTDESSIIEWALREHRVIEVPPAPEGVGYGISLEKQITVPSNRTLLGTGGTDPRRLLRERQGHVHQR